MKPRRSIVDYCELQPAERLSLVLAALDRQDYDYAGLLESTAVSDGFRAYITLISSCMHAGSVLSIHLIATQVFINQIVAATEQTAAGPPQDLAGYFTELVAWQISIWTGFSQSCKKLPLEPRQVLRFAPIAHDDHDRASYLVYDIINRLEDHPAFSGQNEHLRNPEAIQMWRNLFTLILCPPDERGDGPIFQRILAPIPPATFSELTHPSNWQPFPPAAPVKDS